MIVALTALLGAALYAAAGYGGVRAAEYLIPKLQPFEDGPEPREVNVLALVGGAALLGFIVGFKLAPLPDLILYAILTGALVAIWYCDVRTGIVPDLFTLVPLAVGALIALFRHEYWALLSAAVVGLPFAGAALLSRGRGMGWGDAKLAALGGLILGMLTGTFLFGLASLTAVIVSAVRNRAKPVPVAFAPYLVSAIAVGIALGVR
jgi:prepilin signal peptidase PulO-like enzyme (type II secretory pathway)